MRDLPVNTLKPQRGEGSLRTLHRDLLLPCGFLSETEEKPGPVSKTQKARTQQSQREGNNCVQDDNEESYYQFELSSEMRAAHLIKMNDWYYSNKCLCSFKHVLYLADPQLGAGKYLSTFT